MSCCGESSESPTVKIEKVNISQTMRAAGQVEALFGFCARKAQRVGSPTKVIG